MSAKEGIHISKCIKNVYTFDKELLLLEIALIYFTPYKIWSIYSSHFVFVHLV